ncbi:hypothetical protein QE152_g31017 [Popillia japonica]|uniref:Uncharacterized protein n=1 Tax=Popillia japonica TaxID=7064 RepID=A0AAW1JBX8_POPJA
MKEGTSMGLERSEKAKELTRMKEGTSMGLERKPTTSPSRRDNTTSVQDGAPKGPAERKVQQQHEDIADGANLRRGRVAHDIAYASAKEIGADILIVGEPHKNTVRGSDWIKDRKGDVAILFLNKRIVVLKVKPEEGYIYLRFKEYAMYCCRVAHLAFVLKQYG